jgi:hypothetical protein
LGKDDKNLPTQGNGMIIVKNKGDLGNLLFQYAFGYIAARRLKTSFCINKLRELGFFELDGVTSATNLLRKCRFKVESLWHIPEEKNWLEYNDARYTGPETVLAHLADHAVYRGYFQSSAYYAGHEEEVKNLFRIKENYRHRFQQRCASFLTGAPLAVLHLRGKGHGGWDRIRLPWSYYENCLRRIENPERYRWIVVTDDVSYARERLSSRHKMEIVSGQVIDDFLLLNSARIHIMANSTFSWWAAYLNPDPTARIMGPKYWYGHKPEYQFEAPEGIMHPAWEWVPVAEANEAS